MASPSSDPKPNDPRLDRLDGDPSGDGSDFGSTQAVRPCTLPPEGWRCTRPGGHSGPCAAVPISGPARLLHVDPYSSIYAEAANATGFAVTTLHAMAYQTFASMLKQGMERERPVWSVMTFDHEPTDAGAYRMTIEVDVPRRAVDALTRDDFDRLPEATKRVFTQELRDVAVGLMQDAKGITPDQLETIMGIASPTNLAPLGGRPSGEPAIRDPRVDHLTGKSNALVFVGNEFDSVPLEVGVERGDWPAPSFEMLDDPSWLAIWHTIKQWDINDERGEGPHGATGNHATRIFNAIIATRSNGPGQLEVGTDGKGEVVINLPTGITGHITFSPDQATDLASLLLRKGHDAAVERRERANMAEVYHADRSPERRLLSRMLAAIREAEHEARENPGPFLITRDETTLVVWTPDAIAAIEVDIETVKAIDAQHKLRASKDVDIWKLTAATRVSLRAIDRREERERARRENRQPRTWCHADGTPINELPKDARRWATPPIAYEVDPNAIREGGVMRDLMENARDASEPGAMTLDVDDPATGKPVDLSKDFRSVPVDKLPSIDDAQRDVT